MRSMWLIRAARSVTALLVVAAVAGASSAAAKPAPERPARRARAMNLFAVTNAVMDVNRVFCGINNLGELCVDPTNSPILAGGFWPKGTPDQYIFNSGLQLAGIVSPAAGFAWAGDTTGAYFFDARGTQVQGDGITLVYNSLDPTDAAAWPNGAFVRDTGIYHPILIQQAAQGQIAISQQDLWTRAWDGNPGLLSGRTHPMGILVEQRGLAWNFPTGNEDIIYFIFTFYNVTARNAAAYANPTIPPAVQAEIAAVGAEFQDRNEAAFGLDIPDGGYAIEEMYASFSMDPDVGDASHNYSTAVLPFNMGMAYKADFLEPLWSFPPEIFGAPFVPSPGFVGVKYLRSPTDASGNEVGLTMFSNTRNAATAFPDPVGVRQLWRYLSGNVNPAGGDNPCTFPNPLERGLCFLDQQDVDTRFYQASGPLTVPPGEARTIVVAYVHAAPTSVVLPYIGAVSSAQLKPQIPAPGDSIFANPALIRTIERAAGWVSQSDLNGDLVISQEEVVSVPRSLLDKAMVAQSVYDNGFLLPFAPESPRFFLVPGENQVTVTWQPSETETVKTAGGDPFFAIASQPLNPDGSPNALYDPNFLQYDVEGYRIYRGRTSSQLALIAQFDYAGTTITDYTGTFAYIEDLDGDGVSECAPELGVQDDCPDTDPNTPAVKDTFPSAVGVEHTLAGDVIQVPAGGRVQLANGSVLIVQADTAVTGGSEAKRKGFQPLTDTGIGFAFVDRAVRNSFEYYYLVTAFDVNSLTSGPTSLESSGSPKRVTPRRPSVNSTTATVVQGVFGEGGVALDPGAAYPAIDPATGTFNGIMPPANDGAMLLGSAVLEALPAGDIAVRIDSVTPGFTGGIFLSDAGAPRVHISMWAGTDTVRRAIQPPEPGFNSSANPTYSIDQPLVPYDSAGAQRFNIAFTQDVRMPVTFSGATVPVRRTSVGIATTVGRFGVGSAASRYLSHSRWWDAAGTEPADPNIVALPDSAHNSGTLTGVGRIWAPAAYRDAGVDLLMRGYAYAQTAFYVGDFLVTWNADSSITVRDSTHRITLPFSPNGGSGWGFVNERAFAAAGITSGDLDEGPGGATPNVAAVGYNHIYGTRPTCFDDWWAISCADLERTAQYQPLDFNYDGTADANGIALMINGEVFFMEMNAIPAAGTQWRFRAVAGDYSATCTPAIGAVMTDCDAYTYTGPAVRPSRAPGLTYRITVQQPYAVNNAVAGDLSRVHTVPDPYYVTSAFEISGNTKVLKFINLPSRAYIRIYSQSGVLVQMLTHRDDTGGGEATWNLRNRNNQFVASGVYFYHVEGPDGQTKTGRFTVVNFAQ